MFANVYSFDSEYIQAVDAVVNVLDKVEEIAKETPAVDNKGSRFGNPAFKTFYDKVSEVRDFLSLGIMLHSAEGLQSSEDFHKTLPNLPAEAIPEVSAYFCESWGNRLRIDYGSGMELNFLCWMYVSPSASLPGSNGVDVDHKA